MSEDRLWYKKHGLWFRESKFWEESKYGFAPEGLGDVIFNTCDRLMQQILDESDRPWQIGALTISSLCLINRLRWPEWVNRPADRIAKNWWDWTWSRILYQLGINKMVKYRYQKDITRDPFIMFYCCSLTYNLPGHLNIRMPWYLWRPTVHNWYKYLVTKDEKYLRKYERWELLQGKLFGYKDYTYYLAINMANAAGSNKVTDYLLKIKDL